jgi:hypothetical protein
VRAAARTIAPLRGISPSPGTRPITLIDRFDAALVHAASSTDERHI